MEVKRKKGLREKEVAERKSNKLHEKKKGVVRRGRMGGRTGKKAEEENLFCSVVI